MSLRRCVVLGVGLLFAAVGVGVFARQIPPPVDLSPIRTAVPALEPPGIIRSAKDKMEAVKVPTLAEMIQEVEAIRLQKAELDKRERKLVQAIQAQLRQHRDKLRLLGIPEDSSEPPLAEPATAKP
ncbi:MAG: hypothetical protein U0746_04880 [Gemmataceae bacterium]